MASHSNAADVKVLIDEGVSKAAAEVAEMANRATDALLGLVERSADLGDPGVVKNALFSAISQEIISRIAEKISERE